MAGGQGMMQLVLQRLKYLKAFFPLLFPLSAGLLLTLTWRHPAWGLALWAAVALLVGQEGPAAVLVERPRAGAWRGAQADRAYPDESAHLAADVAAAVDKCGLSVAARVRGIDADAREDVLREGPVRTVRSEHVLPIIILRRATPDVRAGEVLGEALPRHRDWLVSAMLLSKLSSCARINDDRVTCHGRPMVQYETRHGSSMLHCTVASE